MNLYTGGCALVLLVLCQLVALTSAQALCKSPEAAKFNEANKCPICVSDAPGIATNCVPADNKAAFVELPKPGTVKIGGATVDSFVLKFMALDGILGEKTIGEKTVGGKKISVVNFKDPKNQLTKGKQVLITGIATIDGASDVCFAIARQICK